SQIALTTSLPRPSFVVQVVNFPSFRRLSPPPGVPSQRLPSRLSASEIALVFERPSLVVGLMNRPSLNSPSPSVVPAQMVPARSWKTDQVTSSPKPSWEVKTVNFPSLKRLMPPPLVPTQRLPS